jgi:mannose-1-phosphate guanylyltransferase / mannose-6-phosphate isomerase
MHPSIVPVILSGGIGTRLWPLSRGLRPKQLLPLTSDKSLLQETVLRATGARFEPPLVLCNDEHRFMIAEQCRALGVPAGSIVLEPEGRNTAPAAVIAALLALERHNDAVVLILPSDHSIGDVDAFYRVVDVAAAAAQLGALVTFGVEPQRPEVGYGYVRRGPTFDGVSGCFRIAEFIEKPTVKRASECLASGDFYWNSGMFMLPAEVFLKEVERLKPEMLFLCRRAIENATTDLDFIRLAAEPFSAVEAVSIDYGIMEHTDKGAVVPADIGWSDVGSWSTLWAISDHDDNGNAISGDVITLDARNCYIRSEDTLVATIGTEDLVIVATEDAVLVARKDRDQDVKTIVAKMAAAGRSEHHVPRQVYRPWGWYHNIHRGPRFQVKEIVVKPGERLSAQMHHHRAEHWIIVSGTAEVTKGNQSFFITENQSTYIPHTTRHSLANPGKIPLKMIEVQSGAYLGEDDIVRYQDLYGRAPCDPEQP